jgi:hypothetical protein
VSTDLQPPKRKRRHAVNVLALVVLPALAALAAVLWAAEERHAFDAGEGSIEDVERRITTAGLQLYSTVEDPEGTANQAVRSSALIVASVIRLRYTQPETPRPYKIPGGIAGVWIVGGIGLLGCLVSFALGFITPNQLKTGSPVVYVGLLAPVTILLCSPPFVLRIMQAVQLRRTQPQSV